MPSGVNVDISVEVQGISQRPGDCPIHGVFAHGLHHVSEYSLLLDGNTVDRWNLGLVVDLGCPIVVYCTLHCISRETKIRV